MVHIEFIGLPGAGKSALRAELLDALGGGPARCVSVEEALVDALRKGRDDALWRCVLKFVPKRLLKRRANSILSRSRSRALAYSRFVSTWPAVADAVTASQAFEQSSPDDRALAILRLTDTAATYQLVSEQVVDDTIVLFDEGFLQRTMSLFISPARGARADSDDVQRYVDAVPLPDIAVLVEAPHATCLERLRSRPRGLPRRLADADDDEIQAFLAAGRELFDALAESIQARGAAVVKVCNDRPPAQGAKNLAEAISRHIEQRPVG